LVHKLTNQVLGKTDGVVAAVT